MSENARPVSGLLRTTGATLIVLVATLAMLMVFDVIPLSTFGELTGKILLGACIVGVAGVGLAFVSGERR